MGWHFRVGERLTSVSVPSGRDVMVGSSRVLKRIGIDLLGKLAMKCRVQNWIGVAMLVFRRKAMTKS